MALSPFAARVGDLHGCPTHGGGLIGPPGAAMVLINHAPAARVGDASPCPFGSRNEIVEGSATVRISHRPAARVGDPTAHGGRVLRGCSTVVIGGR